MPNLAQLKIFQGERDFTLSESQSEFINTSYVKKLSSQLYKIDQVREIVKKNSEEWVLAFDDKEDSLSLQNIKSKKYISLRNLNTDESLTIITKQIMNYIKSKVIHNFSPSVSPVSSVNMNNSSSPISYPSNNLTNPLKTTVDTRPFFPKSTPNSPTYGSSNLTKIKKSQSLPNLNKKLNDQNPNTFSNPSSNITKPEENIDSQGNDNSLINDSNRSNQQLTEKNLQKLPNSRVSKTRTKSWIASFNNNPINFKSSTQTTDKDKNIKSSNIIHNPSQSNIDYYDDELSPSDKSSSDDKSEQDLSNRELTSQSDINKLQRQMNEMQRTIQKQGEIIKNLLASKQNLEQLSEKNSVIHSMPDCPYTNITGDVSKRNVNNNKIKELQDNIDDLKTQIENKEEELEKAKTSYEVDLKNQASQFESRIDQLNNQIRISKREFALHLQNLQSKQESQKLLSQNESIQNQQKLQEQHQRELEELSLKYEGKINHLKEQLSLNKNSLKEKNEEIKRLKDLENFRQSPSVEPAISLSKTKENNKLYKKLIDQREQLVQKSNLITEELNNKIQNLEERKNQIRNLKYETASLEDQKKQLNLTKQSLSRKIDEAQKNQEKQEIKLSMIENLISKYTNQLAKINEIKKSLAEKIKLSKQQLQTLERNIENLQEEKTKKDDLKNKLTNDIEELNSEITTAQKNQSNLLERKENLTKDLENTKNKINELELSISILEKKIETQKSDIRSRDELINSFNKDFKSLKEELEKNKKLTKEEIEKNKKLNEQIEKDISEKNDKIQTLSNENKNLTLETNELKKLQEEKSDQLSQKQNEFEKQKKQLDELNEKLNNLKEELSKKNSSLDKQLKNLENVQNENKDLQSSLKKNVEELKNLNVTLENTKAELSIAKNHEKELDELKKAVNVKEQNLTNNSEKLQNKIDNLKNELSQKNSDFEKTSKTLEDIKKEKENELNQLNASMEKTREDLSNAQKREKDLNIQIEQLKEESLKANQKFENLKSQLDEEVKKKSKVNDDLTSKIKNLEEQLNSLKNDKEKLGNNTQSLEETLNQLQKEKEELQKKYVEEIENYKKKEKELSSSLENAKLQKDNLERDLTQKNQTLLNEKQEIDKQLQLEQKKIETINSNITELTQKLNEMTLTNKNKEELIKSIKSEIETLTAQLEEKKNEIKNNLEKIITLQTELTSLKSNLTSYESKIKEFNNEQSNKENKLLEQSLQISALQNELFQKNKKNLSLEENLKSIKSLITEDADEKALNNEIINYLESMKEKLTAIAKIPALCRSLNIIPSFEIDPTFFLYSKLIKESIKAKMSYETSIDPKTSTIKLTSNKGIATDFTVTTTSGEEIPISITPELNTLKINISAYIRKNSAPSKWLSKFPDEAKETTTSLEQMQNLSKFLEILVQLKESENKTISLKEITDELTISLINELKNLKKSLPQNTNSPKKISIKPNSQNLEAERNQLKNWINNLSDTTGTFKSNHRLSAHEYNDILNKYHLENVSDINKQIFKNMKDRLTTINTELKGKDSTNSSPSKMLQPDTLEQFIQLNINKIAEVISEISKPENIYHAAKPLLELKGLIISKKVEKKNVPVPSTSNHSANHKTSTSTSPKKTSDPLEILEQSVDLILLSLNNIAEIADQKVKGNKPSTPKKKVLK